MQQVYDHRTLLMYRSFTRHLEGHIYSLLLMILPSTLQVKLRVPSKAKTNEKVTLTLRCIFFLLLFFFSVASEYTLPQTTVTDALLIYLLCMHWMITFTGSRDPFSESHSRANSSLSPVHLALSPPLMYLLSLVLQISPTALLPLRSQAPSESLTLTMVTTTIRRKRSVSDVNGHTLRVNSFKSWKLSSLVIVIQTCPLAKRWPCGPTSLNPASV